MSEHSTVYLVISGSDAVERVYVDRGEAEAFVAAYNTTAYGDLDIEEKQLGAPDVAYDGPIWSVTWKTRRKMKGEKQLVLVGADGFTTVIPSAVPTGTGYSDYFAGPSWKDCGDPDYEEPPVWIDHFYPRREWVSGDRPGEAQLTARSRCSVTASGTSKEACEALVRATALEVKAELGIA